jgi:putative DNA primase/helicase
MMTLPKTFNGKVFRHSWPYRDSAGEIIGYTARYDGNNGDKDVIPFFNPDGNGGFKARIPDDLKGNVPLYGATGTDNVFVFEGEKSVDAGLQLGLCAVTSQGGATNTHNNDWSPLNAAQRVIVVPDNDEAGIAYARDVAAILREQNPSQEILLLELPDLPDGGDVVDWIQSHFPDWDGYRPDERIINLSDEIWELVDDVTDWPPAIHLPETCDPVTDAANAQRFVRQSARDILNVDGIGWHCWDESRWIHDEHYVDRQAQRIGRLIRDEAIQAIELANAAKQSDAERKAADAKAQELIAWAKSSESLYRITATKKLAAAHLSYRAAQFDSDPLLLNCPNGTVDLRTGELRPARRSDLITKTTCVSYDPQASYDLWERTVLDICCNDYGLMQFLQRVMGYCLTGLTIEQALFILNGGGSNGKDTFLGRVKKAMGDYAGMTAPNLLMESKSGRHPTEIADLKGVRLAISAESSDSHRLHETRVKQLTGTEHQKARMMRQDFFEFPTQFKLILMTNHRPVIDGDDYAIWRRLHLIPFNQTYKKGENRDDTLPQRLDQELPGILRWCVEGCMEWQQKGLEPPEIVRKATAKYRAEQDVFQQFIDEACVIKKPAQVTAKAFHSAYDDWCRENGERAKSTNWVWPKLEERGVTKKRSSMGMIYYGIGLFRATGK